MKPTFPALLLATAALLAIAGCDDMHDQPSIRPQEAPRLSAPATAVPVQGRIPVAQGEPLENPVAADAPSIARGAELYRINCLLCHGHPDLPGKVGEKMLPPPPNLHEPRIRQLSESDLFHRITFGFGRMPPFERRLDYTDRWHVVNYMRSWD